MNWTPVAERNPIESGLYAVTKQLKDGSLEVTEDWFFPNPTIGNWEGWQCEWPAVTVAWMERPEKYNG
jgi:hypothetical protein